MKDTVNSLFQSIDVGAVFTPVEWAKWLLTASSITEQWMAGKTVADPTGGEGVFLIALCEQASERGAAIDECMLRRLFIIDRNKLFLENFSRKFAEKFSIVFPLENIICTDLVLNPPDLQVDVLVGNPPWVNFNDLCAEYKELLKPHFINWGLVGDAKKVLLGGSRVDLSALILQVSIGALLKKDGIAAFFLPLSLFFGDDAHKGFRRYRTKGNDFAFVQIWELSSEIVFDGVATAYGAAVIRRNVKQEFPVPYFRGKRDSWDKLFARNIREATDPLFVTNCAIEERGSKFSFSLVLNDNQNPRQGVNTCGANDVFIFDSEPPFIPKKYLFPLVTKEVFREVQLIPKRWIFIPYSSNTGRIVDRHELERNDDLWAYLSLHRERLENRKGTMLAATIKRGYWWTLLGVGPYCFAPFKVIWEAFGSRDFRPAILGSVEGQIWQGNQAMHAFIPCWTADDANRIRKELMKPEFQIMLTRMNGGGKCNWAQPGKIKKLLSFARSTEFTFEDSILELG